MTTVNREPIRRFFKTRGFYEELAREALYQIEPLIASVEDGAAGPIRNKRVARDQNEVSNRDLSAKYGWPLRDQLGDTFGDELRAALVEAFGESVFEGFDDSLYMYLGFAACNDTARMHEIWPRVTIGMHLLWLTAGQRARQSRT